MDESAHAATVTTEFSAAGTFSTIANPALDDLANGLGFGSGISRFHTTGNITGESLTDGDIVPTGFGVNASNNTVDVRYKIDLGSSILISSVNSYSWGNPTRAEQDFTLYGSSDPAAATDFDPTNPIWTAIASVDLDNNPANGWGGSSITDINASYQYLMWDTQAINLASSTQQEHTIWKEFDVIAVPEPTTLAMASLALLGTLRRRRSR
ncbi:PEP-CTERM sorting domain-containing protein [Haloferula chungangensis]|uniref:PEP-CTERM sorting domain-containing protein n=2 Tax=Haloferula chungangensis TaxID=1048331 RepID=A0ABW2L5Q0_9BACT